MHVLLVEDDQMIARAIAAGLRTAAYAVDLAADGDMAMAALTAGCHDLMLLDLGLPRLGGMDVLRQARSRGLALPVIIISAREDTCERVEGLDLGADDYIVKPFDLRELLARIRAVVRRHGGHAQSILRAGEVTLDLASHAVTYRGRRSVLPAREFGLLRILAQRPGAICSRPSLEERLYGWEQDVEGNAVEVLIHYIRKRFDKDIIRNVRGAGWMIPKSA